MLAMVLLFIALFFAGCLSAFGYWLAATWLQNGYAWLRNVWGGLGTDKRSGDAGSASGFLSIS
jgi:hypothetical protein